jgi:hypothetical protein
VVYTVIKHLLGIRTHFWFKWSITKSCMVLSRERNCQYKFPWG